MADPAASRLVRLGRHIFGTSITSRERTVRVATTDHYPNRARVVARRAMTKVRRAPQRRAERASHHTVHGSTSPLTTHRRVPPKVESAMRPSRRRQTPTRSKTLALEGNGAPPKPADCVECRPRIRGTAGASAPRSLAGSGTLCQPSGSSWGRTKHRLGRSSPSPPRHIVRRIAPDHSDKTGFLPQPLIFPCSAIPARRTSPGGAVHTPDSWRDRQSDRG